MRRKSLRGAHSLTDGMIIGLARIQAHDYFVGSVGFGEKKLTSLVRKSAVGSGCAIIEGGGGSVIDGGFATAPTSTGVAQATSKSNGSIRSSLGISENLFMTAGVLFDLTGGNSGGFFGSFRLHGFGMKLGGSTDLQLVDGDLINRLLVR